MPQKTNVPAIEIENRIHAVQRRLQKADMAGLLIVQRVDLFYFSGTAQLLGVKKATQNGYADVFLGPPGYKVRFIGHGIGLELVEAPMITSKNEILLKPGMTFSLEPKMVFKDQFTAGIESMFLVTDTGYRLISKTAMDIFVC